MNTRPVSYTHLCGWRPEDISVSFAEFSADHFVNEVTQKIASEELLMASDYIKE